MQRYLGYTRELSGPGVKPVPNFLSIHGINDDTVTLQRCERSLPLFAKLDPAPKVKSISLGAGIHSWGWTDDKLPQGIVPPVAKLWHDAIMNGFFLTLKKRSIDRRLGRKLESISMLEELGQSYVGTI